MKRRKGFNTSGLSSENLMIWKDASWGARFPLRHPLPFDVYHWVLCKLGRHYVMKTVVGLECRYCGQFWDKAEILADFHAGVGPI